MTLVGEEHRRRRTRRARAGEGYLLYISIAITSIATPLNSGGGRTIKEKSPPHASRTLK